MGSGKLAYTGCTRGIDIQSFICKGASINIRFSIKGDLFKVSNEQTEQAVFSVLRIILAARFFKTQKFQKRCMLQEVHIVLP